MSTKKVSVGKIIADEEEGVTCDTHRSEESKVKLWHRVSLVSDLKKGGANRIAYFLHSIFKEQAPPQSGECSLLRWFWSFTGASRAVAARTGATLVVVPQPA